MLAPTHWTFWSGRRNRRLSREDPGCGSWRRRPTRARQRPRSAQGSTPDPVESTEPDRSRAAPRPRVQHRSEDTTTSTRTVCAGDFACIACDDRSMLEYGNGVGLGAGRTGGGGGGSTDMSVQIGRAQRLDPHAFDSAASALLGIVVAVIVGLSVPEARILIGPNRRQPASESGKRAYAPVMSSIAERGLSCSAIYHSTPAARPAADVDRERSRVSLPAGASRRIRVGDQVPLHVQQLGRGRRPRRSSVAGSRHRPPPSRHRLRGRPPGRAVSSRTSQTVVREVPRIRGVRCDNRAGRHAARAHGREPVSSSANDGRRGGDAVLGGRPGTMSRSVPSASSRSATASGEPRSSDPLRGRRRP